MDKIKVLFAGESWFFTTIETKGFDQFTIGGYETEIERVRGFMKGYAEITHIPAHLVLQDFPSSAEELSAYDVVMISDVGANTFLLHPDTFFRSRTTANRLEAIREYVAGGGAFGMMGGYMTFMGFEGKGKWKGTPVEEILPVRMMGGDDRQEHPEGVRIRITPGSHPVLEGLPEEWLPLLGYNRLFAREDAEVVVSCGNDPILTLRDYEKGRTFAWASDCAPHCMPAEFCESDCNKRLWENVLRWVTRKPAGQKA